MHASGLDHLNADAVDPTQPSPQQNFSTAPYVQGSLWTIVMKNIQDNMPTSLYDPSIGQTTQIKPTAWTFNDTLVTDDGNELADASNVSAPSTGSGAYLVQNEVENAGAVELQSSDSVKYASSGQIISDASAYDSVGDVTLHEIQAATPIGVQEGSIIIDPADGVSPSATVLVTDANGATQDYDVSGSPTVQLGIDSPAAATGNGSTILVGADGSTLNNGSGPAFDVALGSNVSIYGGSGSAQADLLGSSEYADLTAASVTLGAGASTNLQGGDDEVALNGSSYVGLVGGAGYTITDSGSGSTVETRPDTDYSLSATGDVAGGNAGDAITVSGGNDRVNLTGGDSVDLQGGSGYTVNASGSDSGISTSADTNFTEQNSGGDPVNIAVNIGDQVNLAGGDAAVSLDGYSANVELEGGSGYTIDALGSGNSVGTYSGTVFTFQNDSGGGGNYVGINTFDQAQLSGGDITAYVSGYAAQIALEGGSGYDVQAEGSGSSISVAYGTSFTEQNNSDGTTYIGVNSDDQGKFIGGNATVYLDGGSTIDLDGGTQNNIYGNADDSGSTITAEAGTNAGINTTGDGVVLLGDDTVDVSGDYNTVSGLQSGDMLTLAGDDNAASDALYSTGGNVDVDNDSSVSLNGSVLQIQLNQGDDASVAGGGSTIEGGFGERITVSNTGTAFDNIEATNDLDNVDATDRSAAGIYLDADTQANIVGSEDSAQLAAGDSLGVYGGNNYIYGATGAQGAAGEEIVVGNTSTSNLSEETNWIYASGDLNNMTASSGGPAGIYIDAGTQANVDGGSNTVQLAASDTVNVYGGDSNTVTGLQAGDTLNLTGNKDVVTEAAGAGGGIVNIGGEGVTLDVDDATVDVAAGSYVTINGTGDNITLGANDDAFIDGGSNTIDNQATDYVEIGQTNGAFDDITGDGDAMGGTNDFDSGTGVFVDADAQANVGGSGDGFSLGTEDSIGLYNADEEVDAGPDDLVYVGYTGGTNDDFDLINANGDVMGDTTANGQPTGIYLQDNVQANVVGNYNEIGASGGDSLGTYGGGNVLYAGTGEDIVLGDTGGVAADTVYAYGDAIGSGADANGTAADGQGTGIYLQDGVQANVQGTANNVSLGAYDNLEVGNGGVASALDTVYGSASDITADPALSLNVVGSADQIASPSPDFVGVFGNDDVLNSGGGAASFTGSSDLANVTDETVYEGVDTQLTVGGNGDVVASNISDNTTVDGNSETVYAAADDTVLLNGSASQVDPGVNDDVTINGNTDIYAGFTDGGTVNVTGVQDVVDGSNFVGTFGTDSQISFDGQNDSIYLGNNVDIKGTGEKDVIDGSGDDVAFSSGSAVYLNGTNDTGSNYVLNYSSAPAPAPYDPGNFGAPFVDDGDGIDLNSGLSSDLSSYDTGNSTIDDDLYSDIIDVPDLSTLGNETTPVSYTDDDPTGGDITEPDDGGGFDDALSIDAGSRGPSLSAQGMQTSGDTNSPIYEALVLNLSGQSVQTQSLATSTAFFDAQNDGQPLSTGWLTAGEGVLVYDPSGDPITQDSQLVAGFSALANLAQTDSSTLDASNPLFGSLSVWVDPTANAQFQPQDLYTLQDLGITSINLAATPENRNSNGNVIEADSAFTWDGGVTGDIADVALSYTPPPIPASTALAANPADQQGLALAMAATASASLLQANTDPATSATSPYTTFVPTIQPANNPYATQNAA